MSARPTIWKKILGKCLKAQRAEVVLMCQDCNRNWKRTFLPNTLLPPVQEVFDRDGQHTQCKDFLIYDRVKNISLISPGSGTTILPVDVVFAIFEVKTTIDQAEKSLDPSNKYRRLRN